MDAGNKKLAKRADQIKARYLAAVNRNDLAEALRIGVDDLLPVSEELADRDAQFLNPLGITLRNVSAISHHLRRPIAQSYFAQRSLHVAVEVEPAGYALHHGLEDIAGVTATIATEIAGKGVLRVEAAVARHGRADLAELANVLDLRHRYEAAAIALRRG